MENKTIDFSKLLEEQPQRYTLNGAKLFIVDNLPPDALAMVVSMASREAGGYTVNSQELIGEKDVQAFHDKYVVGYGHESIADCGNTAIALDKVSMLAAISFEHHPLFSGQETSTRYVDVTGLDYFLPVKKIGLERMISECFRMYRKCLKPLVEHMHQKYPYEEGWNKKVYERTVRAKALDVLGCLLPAGARTNISVVMNLRQLRDHLSRAQYHPLAEIRELSQTSIAMLTQRYPGSFARMGERGEHEEYRRLNMRSDNYYQKQFSNVGESFSPDGYYNDMIWAERKPQTSPIVTERPKGIRLPHDYNELYRFRGSCSIDFRSFRDLHRHRSMTQKVPLLTTKLGFEEWYLQQMPEAMKKRVQQWLSSYSEKLRTLDLSPEDKQYLIPMGYKVFMKFSVGFAQLVYILELRTQQTVHPTVRRVVKSWAKVFQELLPEVRLYADMDKDIFDLKRGSQTIVKKEK